MSTGRSAEVIKAMASAHIAVIVEKNFGFKVKGEEMTDIRTLGDFYEYVLKNVSTES